jgi:hypothetical protein
MKDRQLDRIQLTMMAFLGSPGPELRGYRRARRGGQGRNRQTDWARADTGTLVEIADAVDRRLVSTLPAVHIALVAIGALLPDLASAISRTDLRRSAYHFFITGPSRTADIERVLTIGVHGRSGSALCWWAGSDAASSLTSAKLAAGPFMPGPDSAPSCRPCRSRRRRQYELTTRAGPSEIAGFRRLVVCPSDASRLLPRNVSAESEARR